jgi:hypothetical protein
MEPRHSLTSPIGDAGAIAPSHRGLFLSRPDYGFLAAWILFTGEGCRGPSGSNQAKHQDALAVRIPFTGERNLRGPSGSNRANDSRPTRIRYFHGRPNKLTSGAKLEVRSFGIAAAP